MPALCFHIFFFFDLALVHIWKITFWRTVSFSPLFRFHDPDTMYWSHRALFIRLLALLEEENDNSSESDTSTRKKMIKEADGGREKRIEALARCGHCNADVQLQIYPRHLKGFVHRPALYGLDPTRDVRTARPGLGTRADRLFLPARLNSDERISLGQICVGETL